MASDHLDWQAIEEDADFRELRVRHRRYIAPAAVVCFGAYFGFLVLAVNDPGLLGHKLTGGFTLGYLLMIILFVIVWAVVFGYARIARTQWDPHVERLCENALGGEAQSRYARESAADAAPVVGSGAGPQELTS